MGLEKKLEHKKCVDLLALVCLKGQQHYLKGLK